MAWPWISREHHREVVAAKDALITSLEAQNAVLAERLCEPVAVSVQMPDNFALLQPAIVRRKKEAATGPEPRKELPEVDWANVDANNPFVMAELASREFGRLLSPVELADWTRRVRHQIKAAKEQGIRTPEIPSVGTLETRINTGGQAVPPHIREMVERAEAV
jgi:hypothetical protein